jgi:GT2 family glycosyltransferase
VVVNWNGWRDTCECLKSLEEQTYHNLSIIMVDNGSNDDSVARLKAICSRVMIVETKMNLGYAAGNNVGIRLALEAGADYVWLLNNDTIAPPDTIAKLVSKMLSIGSGAVGSVLYYLDDPTCVQAWGAGTSIDSLHTSPIFISRSLSHQIRAAFSGTPFSHAETINGRISVA